MQFFILLKIFKFSSLVWYCSKFSSIDTDKSWNFPLFWISAPSLGEQSINSFGKLYTEEILEAIIIISNISERDITIKNMEISLFFEKNQKTMAISLPDKDSTLFLPKRQSYSIKFKNTFGKTMNDKENAID